ncbi:protein glxC [Thiohalorhabdus methylotrophus]|uniref:Protein glxC n=1 Tax=Thiohalorhabdus methylotrophus TaxID=3242694 RepID=A0ABV4TTU2_9GAMM
MAGISEGKAPESNGESDLRFDLREHSVRHINGRLHGDLSGIRHVAIDHPDGAHNLAVGVDAPVNIDIQGHAGYFIGGMNQQAEITVHGNVGWSVGENIMSGTVRVKGFASECAAASGHGGLVVIEKDASSRCGISMKGVDIVVGGSVGHMSGFMAQLGTMVICGDAGHGLGDSLYEAVIYIRGKDHGLGADAREEPMEETDRRKVAGLLEKAGLDYAPSEFRRIASGRTLYHWNADAEQEY